MPTLHQGVAAAQPTACTQQLTCSRVIRCAAVTASDPTYTVSGVRDHLKQQGQAGAFVVQKVPEHANLFSELKHYPASTFT